MNKNSRIEAVEHFYDFHPISAQQIFDAVAARGIAKIDITEEVLQLHDQDHYVGHNKPFRCSNFNQMACNRVH